MKKFVIISILFCTKSIFAADPAIEDEELRARDFMRIVDSKLLKVENELQIASWNYESNITDHNRDIQAETIKKVANLTKELWEEAIQFNWKTFSDEYLKRQFKFFTVLGEAALPEEKLTRLRKIVNDMSKIYSTVKLCPFNNKKEDKEHCNLSLEPEIEQILDKSEDPEELKYVWTEFRNAIGPKTRNLYKQYVDLSNEMAHLNNFTDATEMWLDEFEDNTFRQQLESLWEQLKPLYLQIHAYVRYHLRQKYGDIVSEKGPIPAHLLGNMWAQDWQRVETFTLPYPNKKEDDLTEELVRQNYTPLKIFQTAEDFFKSINLTEMPPAFWERSILEKPKGRELVCHASAWDFFDGKDFRIKQCTTTTLSHFLTAHHEMGHIEYFLQYKNLPKMFRSGANSGFHEAIGDLIALSVESRKHLRKIGLLQNPHDDPELILNNLYHIGLSKIVFLPFGYLIDLWRWNVFSGKITPNDYNCKWWELREKYQGVEPPVDRSEEDFDPAAKYHVVADVPYVRYFISFVMQFQFHRALCEKAGEYNPLDSTKSLSECDIYQNVNAGNALKQMLALGRSKPWPQALEMLTGKRTMDATGILEYFKPLQTWLENENKKNNAHIGWEKSTKVCHPKKNDKN